MDFSTQLWLWKGRSKGQDMLKDYQIFCPCFVQGTTPVNGVCKACGLGTTTLAEGSAFCNACSPGFGETLFREPWVLPCCRLQLLPGLCTPAPAKLLGWLKLALASDSHHQRA
jgi:hypothetical protein